MLMFSILKLGFAYFSADHVQFCTCQQKTFLKRSLLGTQLLPLCTSVLFVNAFEEAIKTVEKFPAHYFMHLHFRLFFLVWTFLACKNGSVALLRHNTKVLALL